jgi:aspartyl aminopeptidase
MSPITQRTAAPVKDAAEEKHIRRKKYTSSNDMRTGTSIGPH